MTVYPIESPGGYQLSRKINPGLRPETEEPGIQEEPCPPAASGPPRVGDRHRRGTPRGEEGSLRRRVQVLDLSLRVLQRQEVPGFCRRHEGRGEGLWPSERKRQGKESRSLNRASGSRRPPTWRVANPATPSPEGPKRVARPPKAGSFAINVLGPDGWIPHPQEF